VTFDVCHVTLAMFSSSRPPLPRTGSSSGSTRSAKIVDEDEDYADTWSSTRDDASEEYYATAAAAAAASSTRRPFRRSFTLLLQAVEIRGCKEMTQ
jgi:hypothetical protein